MTLDYIGHCNRQLQEIEEPAATQEEETLFIFYRKRQYPPKEAAIHLAQVRAWEIILTDVENKLPSITVAENERIWHLFRDGASAERIVQIINDDRDKANEKIIENSRTPRSKSSGP